MALNELLFDVPNIRAENCPAKNHVRQGWMRAVCHLFHAFAVHSFVDELAHLNNTNYVDYFLKTIGPDRNVDLTKDGVKPWNNGQSTETFPLDTGRLRRVLEQCAEKSGYAKFRNSEDPRDRDRGSPQLPELCRDGGRGRNRRAGQSHHSQCLDRGGCGTGCDAGPGARAVRRRGGLRRVAGDDGRDHRRGGPDRAVELPQLSGGAA